MGSRLGVKLEAMTLQTAAGSQGAGLCPEPKYQAVSACACAFLCVCLWEGVSV